MSSLRAAGERSDANVLVVDDQAGKLLTYQAILQDLDAHLVLVESAREALDHLLRTEFAVVIIDVCMPELDGFELASMIREHPRFQRTAIIFVSGVHLTEFDRLKGYQVGAVDYLPVPIIPDILRAKVNVFVDLYRKTQEVERWNRELESRVAQRTKELEQAGRQKDEFLAVLAHELRNPLAAIRSAAAVVGLQATPPALRDKCTAVIQRQVEHLVRLIDDLVDVSRITRGLVDLQRQRITVSEVVAQAIEASRPAIDARRHLLTVDVATDPMTVFGDLTRLTQVLGNILNNAAKFTDAGGHITLVAQPQDGQAVIRVIDTGIGIAGEMINGVFELFSQGQPALDRSSAGLGIGLALVRRLVDMHGGRVSVSSDGPGRGTAVTVALPLLDMPIVEEPHAVRPAHGDIPPTTNRYRILVVDDNVDAAEALAVLLRLWGHDVLTAEDGVEALRIGASFAPELTLLDLAMPGLNGLDTARQMRELPWGRTLGLIALTGWGQDRDREQTTAAGFDAHLVKPVDHLDLNRVVARVAALRAARLPKSAEL